jgi:hypothetical protein
MKWVIRKSDKRIMCFTDKQESCLPHVLIVYGGSLSDYEEREGDNAGYETAKAEDPILVAQAAKAQAFLDNLPSWAKVEAAVKAAFPDVKQKAIILKICRAVYWLARDKAD